MRSRRKLLIATFVSLLTASVAHAADRTYFVSPHLIGPAYWTAAEIGVRQAGKDLGVNVLYNGTTTADSASQVNMFQDMLSRHLDGVAIAPNDALAIVPAIKKARDAGIPVITFDSDASTSARQYYLGPADDHDMGRQMAEFMCQQIGGKGQVAYLVAGLGVQNQIDKVAGADAYFKEKCPGIEVVTTLESGDDQQKAFANAQNLLQTYPDLAGIIGYAGGEPPGAAEAVEQAIKAGTLKPGQVKVTGVAVPSVMAPYLKDGTVEKAFIWDPIKLGYAAVYVIDQLGQKKELGDEIDIPTVGKVKVAAKNIYIGTLVITKDNAGDFKF
jgi:rhamnose transport system substrate-binding protein